MKRRLVPVLTALATLTAVIALALPAHAATFVQVLGHKDTYFNHFGDPARGQVRAYAEGQEFDTGLRGKSAMIEVRKVRRVAIYDVELQVLHNGVFIPVAHNPSDVNSSDAQPAVARQWTPLVEWCPSSHLARTYRVRSLDGIRWDDGLFSARTHYSRWFGSRILRSDPLCTETPPPPPPPSADLRVTKTASETSVASATPDAFAYTIAVTNLDGTDNANSVVVTDTLPAEVDLTAAGLPANCTLDSDPTEPDVVTCDLGTVLAGETETVVLGVVSDPAALTDGTVTNTARVSSTTDDPNAANNTSTVAIPIRPLADVAVAKTATQAAVAVPGDAFRYVLTATNSGPSDAAGVLVADVIPAGLDVNAATLPAGSAYNATTRVLTCAVGTLAAGTSVSFSIDVTTNADRADDTAPYVNTARIATTTYEVDTADNTDTLTLPVSTA